MLKKTPKTLACIGMWFGLSSGLSAADFSFQPTSLSMIESWTPQMSFFVSNPSERTIVLKVDTQLRGPMLASEKTQDVALTALPAEIVLQAGERKVIRLDYISESMPRSGNFEVVVEQLPIMYLTPGEAPLPATMVVKRYVAEIEVRPRGTISQYAMTDFQRGLYERKPFANKK